MYCIPPDTEEDGLRLYTSEDFDEETTSLFAHLTRGVDYFHVHTLKQAYKLQQQALSDATKICPECKSYWDAPRRRCGKCGSGMLKDTHPANNPTTRADA
jgi:ribosomal protein S27AE